MRRRHSAALALLVALLIWPASAPAEATTVTFSETIPLTNVPLPNPCAAELVLFNGEVKVLSHLTINDNGSFDLEEHVTLAAAGIGLVSGDKYQASETITDRLNFRIPEVFPVEVSFINHFQITGPGDNDNLFMRLTIHVAINANGEITATVLNVDGGCQ
jgi:hypothetical protein